MYVLPYILQQEPILALETDVNLFPAGYVIRLYTNVLVPTKANVFADYTQLTNVEVPGYAGVAGAWTGAPVQKQDGSWEDQGAAPIAFAASGPPPVPIPVYGWYATDAGNTILLGSGSFDVPFTFTQTGDGFTLEQVISLLQLDGTNYQLHLDMEME